MDVFEKMRLQQWGSDMVDCQNSRLTRKQWCGYTACSSPGWGFQVYKVCGRESEGKMVSGK